MRARADRGAAAWLSRAASGPRRARLAPAAQEPCRLVRVRVRAEPLVRCGSAWTRCASLCRSRASHGASHRRRGGSVRPLQAPAAHLGAGVRAHGGRLRVWRVGVVPCTVGTRGSLGCQSMAMPLLTRIVGPHSAVQLHVVRLDLRRSGRGPRRASTRVRRRAFG